MKYLVFLLPFLMITCSASEKTEEDREARQLFSQSAGLIKDFSLRIKNAPDSAAVDSLIDIFEKKITDINFNFPALTDLKQTEQENDSILNLINQLMFIRSSRLQELGKSNKIVPDSIFE